MIIYLAVFTLLMDRRDGTILGLRLGSPRHDRQRLHERGRQLESRPDGKNRVIAQHAKNEDATFNVALAASTSLKDVDLTVRLKAVAGEVDRGGGLVWWCQGYEQLLHRAIQPARGQLPRLQGPGRQVDAVREREGARRHEVAYAPCRMRGDRITCYLDGGNVSRRDATFPERGKIGLWSKADSPSWFDDMKVGLALTEEGIHHKGTKDCTRHRHDRL